jgi:peptide/nickel transport system substrate-binding protein
MIFPLIRHCPLLAGVMAFWMSAASATSLTDDRVFDVVAPFEIGGLDPSISGFVFQRMQIAETLLDADATGNPLPALAEKWEVSADGTRWRFHLRQGVKFHDGTPLTADVAAHSLQVAQAKTGMLRNAEIKSISAHDGQVVITLVKPFAPLTALLAHSSTNILALASYDAEGNVQKIIGTGPYELTLLEPPQRLEAKRFEDYWGAKPTIQKTSYLGAGRGETRSLMAESGGAELVFQLDPPSIARLKRSKTTQVLIGPVPRVLVLATNSGTGETSSIEVRRALSLAINRDGIAAAVLRAPGTGATQMFADNVAAWHDPGLAPLAYDPQAARDLLKAQSWTLNGAGMLEKNGVTLRLKLLTYSDRPELPLIATAIQAQLREIGVDVEVVVGNASAIPAAHNDGTLQLALYGRNYALVPDPSVTLLADFANGGAEWGPLGWNNPAFGKLMLALLASGDADQKQLIRKQIVALIQDDLPLIPVAWYRQSIAVSNDVAGAFIDPFERTFGLSTMRWAE